MELTNRASAAILRTLSPESDAPRSKEPHLTEPAQQNFRRTSYASSSGSDRVSRIEAMARESPFEQGVNRLANALNDVKSAASRSIRSARAANPTPAASPTAPAIRIPQSPQSSVRFSRHIKSPGFAPGYQPAASRLYSPTRSVRSTATRKSSRTDHALKLQLAEQTAKIDALTQRHERLAKSCTSIARTAALATGALHSMRNTVEEREALVTLHGTMELSSFYGHRAQRSATRAAQSRLTSRQAWAPSPSAHSEHDSGHNPVSTISNDDSVPPVADGSSPVQMQRTSDALAATATRNLATSGEETESFQRFDKKPTLLIDARSYGENHRGSTHVLHHHHHQQQQQQQHQQRPFSTSAAVQSTMTATQPTTSHAVGATHTAAQASAALPTPVPVQHGSQAGRFHTGLTPPQKPEEGVSGDLSCGYCATNYGYGRWGDPLERLDMSMPEVKHTAPPVSSSGTIEPKEAEAAAQISQASAKPARQVRDGQRSDSTIHSVEGANCGYCGTNYGYGRWGGPEGITGIANPTPTISPIMGLLSGRPKGATRTESTAGATSAVTHAVTAGVQQKTSATTAADAGSVQQQADHRTVLQGRLRAAERRTEAMYLTLSGLLYKPGLIGTTSSRGTEARPPSGRLQRIYDPSTRVTSDRRLYASTSKLREYREFFVRQDRAGGVPYGASARPSDASEADTLRLEIEAFLNAQDSRKVHGELDADRIRYTAVDARAAFDPKPFAEGARLSTESQSQTRGGVAWDVSYRDGLRRTTPLRDAAAIKAADMWADRSVASSFADRQEGSNTRDTESTDGRGSHSRPSSRTDSLDWASACQSNGSGLETTSPESARGLLAAVMREVGVHNIRDLMPRIHAVREAELALPALEAFAESVQDAVSQTGTSSRGVDVERRAGSSPLSLEGTLLKLQGILDRRG